MIVATVRLEWPEELHVCADEHTLNALPMTPRAALVGDPFSSAGCVFYLDGRRLGRVMQGPDVRPDLTPYFADDTEPVGWIEGRRTVTFDVYADRPEEAP
jgi:hypothetical protein